MINCRTLRFLPEALIEDISAFSSHQIRYRIIMSHSASASFSILLFLRLFYLTASNFSTLHFLSVLVGFRRWNTLLDWAPSIIHTSEPRFFRHYRREFYTYLLPLKPAGWPECNFTIDFFLSNVPCGIKPLLCPNNFWGWHYKTELSEFPESWPS